MTGGGTYGLKLEPSVFPIPCTSAFVLLCLSVFQNTYIFQGET